MNKVKSTVNVFTVKRKFAEKLMIVGLNESSDESRDLVKRLVISTLDRTKRTPKKAFTP